MPRIVVCGRRLNASSDDFVGPSSTSILARVFWIASLISLLSVFDEVKYGCLQAARIYLYSGISISGIGIVLDATLLGFSCMGSLSDFRPRRAVVPLLMTRTAYILLDVAVAAYGLAASVWAPRECRDDRPPLPSSLAPLLQASAGVSLVASCILATAVGMAWALGMRGRKAVQHAGREEALLHLSGVWASRCSRLSFLCRGLASANPAPWDTVGAALACVFAPAETLDLTASDVMAGLLLVRAEQMDEAEAALRAFAGEKASLQSAARRIAESTAAADDLAAALGQEGEGGEGRREDAGTARPPFPVPLMSHFGSLKASLRRLSHVHMGGGAPPPMHVPVQQGRPSIARDLRAALTSLASAYEEAASTRRAVAKSTGSIGVDMCDPTQARIVVQAAHLAHWARAAYGLPLYMLEHVCTWGCRLAVGLAEEGCREWSEGGTVGGGEGDVMVRRHYTGSGGVEGGTLPRNPMASSSAVLRVVLRGEQRRAGARLRAWEARHGGTLLGGGITAGLPPFRTADLLHADHTNAFFRVPWFVAVDRGASSLVVVIRGTLSADDILTDGLAVPLCLSHDPEVGLLMEGLWGRSRLEGGEELAPGVSSPIPSLASHHPLTPSQCLVHAGMWQAARQVRDELMSKGLLLAASRVGAGGESNPLPLPTVGLAQACLQGAMHSMSDLGMGRGGEEGRPRGLSAEALAGPADLPSLRAAAAHGLGHSPIEPWEGEGSGSPPLGLTGVGTLHLVLVGHSLGAGVASLLALQLRPWFPTLQAVALSAPGACVSPALARAMTPFVTTVVVGKDLVPRLSLPSAEATMRRAVDALRRARVSKPRLMARATLDIVARVIPIVPSARQIEEAFWGKGDTERPNARLLTLPPPVVGQEVFTPPLADTEPCSGDGLATLQARRALLSHPMHLPGRILQLVKVGSVAGDACSQAGEWLGAALAALVMGGWSCVWGRGRGRARLEQLEEEEEGGGGLRGAHLTGARVGRACAGTVCCCVRYNRGTYEPRWAAREALARSGILVSASCVADHMPDKAARVLDAVLREYESSG